MTMMINDDEEADAMFLGAVQCSLWDAIKAAISKHCSILPARLAPDMEDWVSEQNFTMGMSRRSYSKDDGSPDLFGDQAYRDYVKEKLANAATDTPNP